MVSHFVENTKWENEMKEFIWNNQQRLDPTTSLWDLCATASYFDTCQQPQSQGTSSPSSKTMSPTVSSSQLPVPPPELEITIADIHQPQRRTPFREDCIAGYLVTRATASSIDLSDVVLTPMADILQAAAACDEQLSRLLDHEAPESIVKPFKMTPVNVTSEEDEVGSSFDPETRVTLNFSSRLTSEDSKPVDSEAQPTSGHEKQNHLSAPTSAIQVIR